MKKTVTLFSVICLLGIPTAHAAFQAISTFQDSSLASFLEEHSPTIANGGSGGISVVADPFGTDASNKVLKLSPGTFVNGVDVNNVWFTVPIPTITGKATIYYRMAVTDDTDDVLAGVCLLDPQAYGDYGSIVRHQNVGIIDWYSNTSYVVPAVDTSYPAKKWLKVWQVVDAAANTFDLWVQAESGTKWTTPTKLVTAAIFRNKGTTGVKYFSARCSSGSAANPSSLNPNYFDDIYVDTAGENVTVPGSVTPTSPLGKFINVSTRGYVGTGDSVMIVGFVITEDARKVLIRGVGPGLAALGVSGTLVDPQIQVFAAGGTTAMATNDNWGTGTSSVASEITAAAVASGAFALPANSLDAAMILTLPIGSYTVVASGKNNGTGNAIVEVYQLK